MEKKQIKKVMKKKGVKNGLLKKKLGEQCIYCNCNNPLVLTIDHKNPLIRGGPDEDSNKQVTCFTCNQLKGGLNDKEFKQYMKALKILKEVNKLKLDVKQAPLLFSSHAFPRKLKELEDEEKGNI